MADETRSPAARWSAALAAAAPIAIVVLAAVLRLWALNKEGNDPFYDAAVRSMGLSWHNFFFGAIEPAGGVAVDKAPVDLWLQVASTKLFGFTTTGLHLPEALGGTAAVALMYGAVRSVAGRLAGCLAALALAVLPISVVTSRSDTMDSVMMALLVGALWAAVHALKTRRGRWVLVSAALVGLAFNVKLAQALIPLPALALMWWAVPRAGGRRIALAAGAAAALVAVSMAWVFTASLTPASQRPYPIGSGTGSIYRVVFVFNGIDRLRGNSAQLAPYGGGVAPGVTRLWGTKPSNNAQLIGIGLIEALLLGGAALLELWLTRSRRATPDAAATEAERAPPEAHAARWLAVGLGVWLAIGVLLFSKINHLQTRYLETLSPAATGIVGLATAWLLARATRRGAAWALAVALAGSSLFAIVFATRSAGVLLSLLGAGTAVALLTVPELRGRSPAALVAAICLALFAVPTQISVDSVRRNASDSAPEGTGAQFSSFLRAQRHGARYEVASTEPLAAVGLIVRDAQPVLILADLKGPIVPLPKLQQLVRRGDVRFIIIPHPCRRGHRCAATTRWSLQNSTSTGLNNLYRFLPTA